MVITSADEVRDQERLEYARCLKCGYRLRGLSSDCCPECGRTFNPYDPWTLWLPDRPNFLARWLLRRPTILGRSFPWIAVAAVAWGARVPGWSSPALQIAAMLFAACTLGSLIWYTMIVSIHRREYPDRGETGELKRFLRKIAVAGVISILLLALRPTLYVSFWISRPWLDRVARGILATPHNTSTPYVGQYRGLYFLGDTRRCPHGLKLHLQRYSYDRDSGPGFVYFAHDESNPCTRFHTGRYLGGGWYASD